MSWGSWSTWATVCAKPPEDRTDRTDRTPPCYRPAPPDERPREPHPAKPDKLQLKTLVVVAEEKVQKVGELAIPAPIGVCCDAHTGDLTHCIRLEPVGDPVFRPLVLKDKLVNEGFLTVRVHVDDKDPQPCPDVRKQQAILVSIPFQSIHDLQGICPGDHVQEFAKIEALIVTGIPTACSPGQSGSVLHLNLKAILEVHIIVARECIVSVSGDIKRCLPYCGAH